MSNRDKNSKARLKSAEKVRRYKTERGNLSSSMTVVASPPGQTAKSLLGDCPPFNRAVCWIADTAQNKIYLIGGRRFGDKLYLPTSDFYCLDIASMRWFKLTHLFKFRDMEHPFSFSGCQRNYTTIPKLTLPGHALLRLHETSFLLLFGGYDADADLVSSRLIMVDLDHFEWWYQPVEGGIVTERINPTMVVVDRKLYIFGGFRKYEDREPHGSFSIASLSDDEKGWSWEVRDAPYPEIIPPGTILGRAIAIYEGTKILLTRCTPIDDDRINLGENDIFCFHIARRKFQLVDVSGDFPGNISSKYFTFPMSPPICSAQEATRAGPSRSAHLSSSSSYRPVASSSVIICGFINWADGSLIPEVWHLELTPIEDIRKLKVAPIIAEVDSQLDTESDLQAPVMIGDRLFLLGSRPEDPARDASLTFNVYFEVPLHRLCARDT